MLVDVQEARQTPIIWEHIKKEICKPCMLCIDDGDVLVTYL